MIIFIVYLLLKSVQKSEKTRHGDILKLQQSENQIYTV